MPWWSDLVDILQHRSAQRALMAAWFLAWTIGGALVVGYRLDRFLMRQWSGAPPLWYPRDGATWAGLAVGAAWAIGSLLFR